MESLEGSTHATFAERLGETFLLRDEDAEPLELTLVEATELAPAAGLAHARAPFSIVFRGPLEPVFGQGIHRLENAAIGVFELFLVPIGPDAEGMQYEAIFT